MVTEVGAELTAMARRSSATRAARAAAVIPLDAMTSSDCIPTLMALWADTVKGHSGLASVKPMIVNVDSQRCWYARCQELNRSVSARV